MNIFRFEFKGYARSLWLWGLSVAALQFIFMVLFPSLARDAEAIDRILAAYPPEMLAALGMDEIVSLATVMGFYTFLFVFVQLCLSIQSAYYGFNFLSVEERERTADFLFSMPVTRSKILLAKFMALLTALFIMNLSVVASAFLAIELFREGKAYDASLLLLLLATLPLFQLVFVTTGMLVTALTTRIKSVLGYAMTLSFALYMMNSFRAVFGADSWGLFTPFYHFRPAYILREGSWPLWGTIGSAVIVVVFFSTSIALYNRRNIQAF